jgi:hypothetical protein
MLYLRFTLPQTDQYTATHEHSTKTTFALQSILEQAFILLIQKKNSKERSWLSIEQLGATVKCIAVEINICNSCNNGTKCREIMGSIFSSQLWVNPHTF